MNHGPLPFVKMEGLGNSYIFVESANIIGANLSKLAEAISHPATGLGGDGLIMIDCRKRGISMRIFNRDGSEAELCGNGLRQVAWYLKKYKFRSRRKFIISTLAGDFKTEIISSRGQSAQVKTTLGTPDFSAAAVGLSRQKGLAFDVKLHKVKGRPMLADCVSMGNPHAVISVNDFEFDWQREGETISTNSKFEAGINVHFIKVRNPGGFEMKTFERGSGATLPCGSGAAACLAAGVMKNLLNKKATATMPGGKLNLQWDMNSGVITQVGPTSVVCRGEYSR